MMISTLSHKNSWQWVDRFGTCASSLCAIHCLMMPFLVVLLPVLGTGWLASSNLEWGMIAIAATLGALSTARGFRIHNKRVTLILFFTGITLLLYSRMVHADPAETCCALHPIASEIYPLQSFLSACGGILVALTHLSNQHFCKQCNQCQK